MVGDAIKGLGDLALLPLQVFPDEVLQSKLGVLTFAVKRCSQVLPQLKGLVLGIGCGENRLIKEYRNGGRAGVGFDVFPRKGPDVLCDAPYLPFKDSVFDTVRLVARLNHITERLKCTLK